MCLGSSLESICIVCLGICKPITICCWMQKFYGLFAAVVASNDKLDVSNLHTALHKTAQICTYRKLVMWWPSLVRKLAWNLTGRPRIGPLDNRPSTPSSFNIISKTTTKMTWDRWWEVNLLSKCHLPRSHGLGVKEFLKIFHKVWIAHWLNYKGVCTTAPATPGLLTRNNCILCKKYLM